HVEFMYDPSGGGSPTYYIRKYFVPQAAVNPTNDCPNSPWAGGGQGVDPCAVLVNYMHGIPPGGAAPLLTNFLSDSNFDVSGGAWRVTAHGNFTSYPSGKN